MTVAGWRISDRPLLRSEENFTDGGREGSSMWKTPWPSNAPADCRSAGQQHTMEEMRLCLACASALKLVEMQFLHFNGWQECDQLLLLLLLLLQGMLFSVVCFSQGLVPFFCHGCDRRVVCALAAADSLLGALFCCR